MLASFSAWKYAKMVSSIAALFGVFTVITMPFHYLRTGTVPEVGEKLAAGVLGLALQDQILRPDGVEALLWRTVLKRSKVDWCEAQVVNQGGDILAGVRTISRQEHDTAPAIFFGALCKNCSGYCVEGLDNPRFT